MSALDLWLTSEEKTASKDEISWALEKKGTYTTSSMYRFLSHRGVVNTRSKRLWKSKLPMKLKVFAWLVFHNRIQTGVELKKRHWKGDPRCGICGAPESRDHLFFGCVLARFTWACFKKALGWDRTPNDLQDFLDVWLPLDNKDYSLKLFLLILVPWALWTVRNKRVMESKYSRRPIDVLFKINFFLQKWGVPLKSEDKAKNEQLKKQVQMWVERFQAALMDRQAEEDFI